MDKFISKLKLTVLASLMAMIALPTNAGVISLADDSYLEQSLEFEFTFFGITYTDVYIGSNGFLTFGQGSTDWSESVANFLTEEPKIAIWNDFDPSSSGTISVTSTSSYFTVSYDLVPQSGSSDQNSFDITIFSDGSIELYFESLASSDLLVGITAGEGTGTAVDFSTSSIWSNLETSYQLFGGDFDLQGQTIRFESSSVNVPEPSTILFFSFGVFAIGAIRKKQKPIPKLI